MSEAVAYPLNRSHIETIQLQDNWNVNVPTQEQLPFNLPCVWSALSADPLIMRGPEDLQKSADEMRNMLEGKFEPGMQPCLIGGVTFVGTATRLFSPDILRTFDFQPSQKAWDSGIQHPKEKLIEGLRAWQWEPGSLLLPDRRAYPAFSREPSVGTILYSSWGYDQTNLEWLVVTKKTRCTVDVQRIGGVAFSRSFETGSMAGYALPNLTHALVIIHMPKIAAALEIACPYSFGRYKSKRFANRLPSLNPNFYSVGAYQSANPRSFHTCHPWRGESKYWSNYA